MLKWNKKSDRFKVEPDPIESKNDFKKKYSNPNRRYEYEDLVYMLMAGVALIQLILLIIISL